MWRISSPDTLGALPQGNHNLTFLNRSAFVRKQNLFVFFAVIKLMVHSSLASCPGSSPKEYSLWKTPSPDTPDALPQENHTLIRKQNLFVFFAVIKLVVHSSLASCQGSSLKECFLWKTPSPDIPDALPQENHTFIRKQNLFVLFVVIKLVVHSSLASCQGSSLKECFLWKTPSPDTPGTLPQENHTFIRKQNLFVFFVFFAVIKLVYALSESYRPRTPSGAIS